MVYLELLATNLSCKIKFVIQELFTKMKQSACSTRNSVTDKKLLSYRIHAMTDIETA